MLRVTRRSLLTVSAIGMAGAGLAACSRAPSPAAGPPVAPKATVASSPVTSTVKATVGSATPVTGGPAAITVTAASAVAATVSSNSSGKIVVKLMHFYGTDLMDNLNRRLAVFNDGNTKYQVDGIEATGGSAFRDKLVTMIAGGVAPDAFLISQAPGSGYAFGMLAFRGQLVELGPLIQRDHYDIQDYFKVIVDYDTYKGKLFALPNDINVYAFFYNVDLFKEAGLPLLPEKWGDEAWNWQALVDRATKLTKRSGGRATQYGFLVTSGATEWLRPWLWNNGASDLSPDWTSATINTPAAIEALTFLQDLIYRYKVAPTPADLQTLPGAQQFFTGRLGMNYTGAVFVNSTRTSAKKFAWDTGPNVVGKAAHVTAAGGASWAMSPQSKVQEGAWELIKTLSGPKSQEIGAHYGQMPSRISVANSSAYLNTSNPPPHLAIFIEAAKNARPGYLVTNWAQIEDAMNKELDNLWLNKKKPADVAAAMETAMNALLKQSTKLNE